jgi:hypothetical protein
MDILKGLEGINKGGLSYYRNAKTGDKAYLVERNGVTMVKLDRPNEEIIRRFIPEEWIPDNETKPFTRAQVAMAIKAFDQKLCHFLGHVKLAKTSWKDMPEKERVEWIKGIGPQKPLIRQLAFQALYKVFEEYMRDG